MQVIAEPGRYYVSSAYTLACHVHSKRDVRRGGKLKSTMYYLNDGVYGSFNCQLYDHKIVYPLTLKPDTEGIFIESSLFSQVLSIKLQFYVFIFFLCTEKFPSSLWGPSCDALDCVSAFLLYFIIFSALGARPKFFGYGLL